MLSYHRTLRVFLLLMLFSIMLTPSFRVVETAPRLRVEEILIVALFGYLVLIALSNGRIEYAWGLRQTLLAFFPVFIFTSIAVGMWLGYDNKAGDLNQLIRLAKYIIVYTLAVTVVTYSADPDRTQIWILRIILALSIVLFGVALQQYLNLFGLNALYIESISEAGAWRLRDATYRPRPIGLIGNPNELGFLFAVASLAGFYLVLKQFRAWYVPALLLSLGGVALSGSRSSLVATAAGMVVIAFAMLFLRRGSGRLLRRFAAVTLSLLVVGTGVLAWADTGRLFYRLEGVLEPSEDLSWQVRLERWEQNIEIFQTSPIVGVGPLRYADDGEIVASADGEWWLLLRTYGLAGTLFLVAAMLGPLVFGRRWDDGTYLTLGVLAGTAVYMIPAAVFHSLTLMPLVLVLAALDDTTVRRKAL